MTKLLTVGEVAKQLSVSPVFVRQHASCAKQPRRPVIPALKLGGAVRFRPEAIDRFVAELEVA